MSRAGVRAAVAAYFSQVPGFSTFFRSEPYFTPGEAWTINGVKGTVGFIHMAKQDDSLLDLTGGAHRDVPHIVTIVVLYQYRIPPRSTNGMPDGWSDDLDTLLDNMAHALRLDPTIGTGVNGVVWQAGIMDHDMTIESDMPIVNGGKIWCLAYMTFIVQEIVIAP